MRDQEIGTEDVRQEAPAAGAGQDEGHEPIQDREEPEGMTEQTCEAGAMGNEGDRGDDGAGEWPAGEEAPPDEPKGACADPDVCGEVPEGPAASELSTRELGKRGEQAAARYLAARGFEILERNWTCRYGEADIIALDEDGALCFVEVKTRRSIEAGVPEDAVTPQKQQRYERIAMSYLVESGWDDDVEVRFDIIAICVTDEHRALLRFHRACFDGRSW